MAFIQTMRWYGPHDIVSLRDIRQAGATGVVSALHHIPVGEVWPVKEIIARKRAIEWDEDKSSSRSLTWEVVESVNIHEDIKMGRGSRDLYIRNYQETIRNIAKAGVKVICYNFMPVLDWTRTDLFYPEHDESYALRFDMIALAAFDIYILERVNAPADYTDEVQDMARVYYDELSETDKEALTLNILAGLPGTNESIPMGTFRDYLKAYSSIDRNRLRENLKYFLQRIIPVAEEAGVRMCIHPDDPPYQIFGLPRIMGCAADFEFLLSCVDSFANGITFCTGSLGPNPNNDMEALIERFGHRIHFLHLRNVQRQEYGSFYEADHLGGSVDMYAVVNAIQQECDRRKREGRIDHDIPMRPDHGHQMLDDMTKEVPFPGYSAVGRLRGLAELRGLELGILRSK